MTDNFADRIQKFWESKLNINENFKKFKFIFNSLNNKKMIFGHPAKAKVFMIL
jgi:hypothetical protein